MYAGLWERGPLLGKGAFGSVFLAKPTSKFRSFTSLMATKSAEISVSATLQKEKEVFENVQGYPFVIHYFGEDSTVEDNGVMVYNLLLEYASGGSLRDLIHNSSGCGLPESDVKRSRVGVVDAFTFISSCNSIILLYSDVFFLFCILRNPNLQGIDFFFSLTNLEICYIFFVCLDLEICWESREMR